jgi:hypothetical protein
MYYSMPIIVAPFMHASLYCAVYHYSYWHMKERTQIPYSKVITHTQRLLRMAMNDFYVFVAPYLSGTQVLVYLFRVLGAQIGCDVILPNIRCLTDPHLVTIGDHVRLNTCAYIQVRHFVCIDYCL